VVKHKRPGKHRMLAAGPQGEGSRGTRFGGLHVLVVLECGKGRIEGL